MAVTQVELVATCGEILTLEQEEGSNRDKFAVSLLKHATVFGHVPQEFSRLSTYEEFCKCKQGPRRRLGICTNPF